MKNKETSFCKSAQRTESYVTDEQKGVDTVIRSNNALLFEVTVQKALKSPTMTCLVACHLVHGVVDCVKAFFFGAFGKFEFTAGCAVFRFNAFLKILFGGGAYEFTEKFAEFCGVFSLFEGCFFPVKTNFGITFTVCGSCHCEIHTNLGAFAFEVRLQAFVDVLRNALTDADDVFCRPSFFRAVVFDEFDAGATALGAFFGCAIAFVNVTADGTYKF